MSTNIKESLGIFGGYLIGIGFMASLSIIGYQILFWFQTDSWLSLPFYKLIYYFDIDLYFVLNIKSHGMREFLIFILELPLSVVALILSSTIGYSLYLVDSKC